LIEKCFFVSQTPLNFVFDFYEVLASWCHIINEIVTRTVLESKGPRRGTSITII
jgi:hypothetical protein